MTSLNELEDLLRRGEKEKAYELMKEYRGIKGYNIMFLWSSRASFSKKGFW